VFYPGPACKLIDADAPVNLDFLADGEAVRVDEEEIDTFERGNERGFVEAVAREEGDVGESAKFCGVR